jgi:hypothetical protein
MDLLRATITRSPATWHSQARREKIPALPPRVSSDAGLGAPRL